MFFPINVFTPYYPHILPHYYTNTENKPHVATKYPSITPVTMILLPHHVVFTEL